jgi:hypothetical protein
LRDVPNLHARQQTREFQLEWNAFVRRFDLHYKPLKVDGVAGKLTRIAIKKARFFLGVGSSDWRKNSDEVTRELLLTLDDPFRRVRGYGRRENLRRRRTASKRRKARIQRWEAQQAPDRPHLKGTSPGAPHWGGSVYVVSATRPIATRFGHPITSTKRWPPIGGNMGSWHNSVNQPLAWADDYGTFDGAEHAQAIRTYWGNHAEASGTFAIYLVEVDGRVFRKQTLWAVAGHGDHVHDGAAV